MTVECGRTWQLDSLRNSEALGLICAPPLLCDLEFCLAIQIALQRLVQKAGMDSTVAVAGCDTCSADFRIGNTNRVLSASIFVYIYNNHLPIFTLFRSICKIYPSFPPLIRFLSSEVLGFCRVEPTSDLVCWTVDNRQSSNFVFSRP